MTTKERTALNADELDQIERHIEAREQNGEMVEFGPLCAKTLLSTARGKLNTFDDLVAACEAALRSSESMWGTMPEQSASDTARLQSKLRAALKKAKG